MKVYRVIVSMEDQLVFTSNALAGFESARAEMITQLLDTAENDWSVQVEDIEHVLPMAEDLVEEDFRTPIFLGQYAHIIVEEEEDADGKNG
jgi:hypothetical protein